MATKTLTTEKADWLKENFKQYKIAEIAEKLAVKEYIVSIWLKSLGLKKINRGANKPEGRQIKWLSSEYSNVTREQHIDRILAMNV